MLRRAAIAFALVAWTAGIAVAAEDDGFCHGTIFRSVSRFRGTIHSVWPLTKGGTDLSPIDPDPLFGVAIDIEGVGRQNFAIHSPSLTFGTGKLTGRTFDLVAERMDCNDTFQRYVALWMERRTRFVEPLEREIEIGHFYRTKVTWKDDTMSMPHWFDLPMHHDGEIIFTNLADLGDKHPSEIVFEVQSVRINQTGERRWLSSYELRIVPEK